MKKVLLTLIISTFVGSTFSQSLLNNEFIIGTDLSMTKAILDNGGVYMVDNQAVDVFESFKERKYEYARLRLFHTPDGNESNGTVNSLDYTIQLAKQIKASGMKLLLDFHYSDTWADPSQQTKPEAWNNLDFVTLNDSVYEYTKFIMNRFSEEDIYPDMVQTGNEIHHGMLWDDGRIWIDGQPNWENFTTLLKSAISGVRDSDGGQEIPVMVHAFSADDEQQCITFMDKLWLYNVNFDVIGMSYYNCWSGNMDVLDNTLSYLDSNYDMDIIIAETSYNWDGSPADYCVIDASELQFPYTEQGQYDYLQALYAKVIQYPAVKGIFYWGGDYIWAGDVGGSWSSLFHWEGNAMNAFDAFSDLLPADEIPYPESNPYKVHKDASGMLVIGSSQNSPLESDIAVYDISGRKLYQKFVSEFPVKIDLFPANKRVYLLKIIDGNKSVYTYKILY